MCREEISESYPNARKKYLCDWCNELIEINEKHYQCVYKYIGEIAFKRMYLECGKAIGKMHIECEKAMNQSEQDLLKEGWTPGDMKRGEKYNWND